MRLKLLISCMAAALLGAGCASVSSTGNAFLGSPRYAPTEPAGVQILSGEPAGSNQVVRLGQVFLDVQGRPPREELEQRLRTEAAKLGANAVYVVSDRLHIFPQVFSDFWTGPSQTFEETHRDIVAVAVRVKTS